MTELGWKSVGALELTALPGIDRERWVSWVREADALLVNGGDPLYLCHWMRESGLAGLFPSLCDTVYVGLSAGSTVLTPRTGYELADRQPPAGDDSLLGSSISASSRTSASRTAPIRAWPRRNAGPPG
jgi:dipeptidase E